MPQDQIQAILIMKILGPAGTPEVNAVCYRKDQKYGEAEEITAALLAEHHPGCTATHAILDDALRLEGKDIDSDVDIVNGEVVIT